MRKLSLEEIKKITVGALSIEQKEDSFYFYKCTQKQIDVWNEFGEDLGRRSRTTSGIRLDFHTDSLNFEFKVKTGIRARYEVYIDGVLEYVIKEQESEQSIEKNISLDGKKHRITLYMPSHAIGVLEWVKLVEKAEIQPHKYDCKILFLGDSITQGWDSTWDSLSYAQTVSRFFNADSVIQGIGGATFRPSTFDDDINYDPDIVIVAYGTNDWTCHKSIEKAQSLCSEYLDCVMKKYGDKKVFGISPIWRGDKDKKLHIGTLDVCTSYIKDEIKKHGMILIDGEKLTPHHSEFYCDGYLHPNATGHNIFANNLIKMMLRYI